ncbi:PfkB family carbohydrate kinase [Neorhizobium sp. S3-V5DH]|uniref:PfkB family carbohydrate kinase n=1 Tax=Neorhizobium sp. S3-V5DH TaxID=2485166 RepID=UPI0010E39319|nr:pfkB family carbohydrate kinase [Neorhizobium sp. S3-V5DH]
MAVFPEVVVTAGGAGAAYANHDGEEILIAGVKVKVESTHGAGDEFIGVLAAELASRKTMNDAFTREDIDGAKLVGTPETQLRGGN